MGTGPGPYRSLADDSGGLEQDVWGISAPHSQSAGSSALLTLPSPHPGVLVLLLKAGVGEGALIHSANVSLVAWILLEPGRAQTEVVYTGF